MQAGGKMRSNLPVSGKEVTRAFANHVRTFCYTRAQVRPMLVIAQLTLPNTRQVLPPSVMMLVKGRGIDRCNKIWRASVLGAGNKKMQACCCTATKRINGSCDQTQWIKPCPKVSSTRLALRFFQDDGCGAS